MLKAFAILTGLVFIIIGILGFLPDFSPDGKILGLFAVNFEHNVLHLVSGAIAILCGLSSGFASKIYFLAMGLIYAYAAYAGFIQKEELLFNRIIINQADNWLHLGMAVVFLSLGLFVRHRR